MHYKLRQNTLNQLIGQRNNALLIIVGLFVICVIQLFIMYRLMNDNKTNFTPLPPISSEPFTISRNSVSSGYLADMSRYFAMLKLNYTPASLPPQMQLLLRYTDARFYGALKQLLNAELTDAKAHDISLAFMPVDTVVNSKDLQVTISGDLIRVVGKTPLPAVRVSYQIVYAYHDGVLKVLSMQPLSNIQQQQEDKSHA